MTTKIDSSEVRKMIDKRKFAIECAFEIAEDTYIESVRVQPEKRFLWFVIRPEKVRSRKECIEYLNKTADESGLCMFDGWHLIRHRKKYWIEYM
jgi:ADP-dependent phosphofructokinase/glucokinase